MSDLNRKGAVAGQPKPQPKPATTEELDWRQAAGIAEAARREGPRTLAGVLVAPESAPGELVLSGVRAKPSRSPAS